MTTQPTYRLTLNPAEHHRILETYAWRAVWAAVEANPYATSQGLVTITGLSLRAVEQALRYLEDNAIVGPWVIAEGRRAFYRSFSVEVY